MFETLYTPFKEEREIFGKAWCGPAQYKHRKTHLIARYRAHGDGQPVSVFCNALPARFYTVKARKGKDSMGEPVKPWTLTTGAGMGMARLAKDMAEAASAGMLGAD